MSLVLFKHNTPVCGRVFVKQDKDNTCLIVLNASQLQEGQYTSKYSLISYVRVICLELRWDSCHDGEYGNMTLFVRTSYTSAMILLVTTKLPADKYLTERVQNDVDSITISISFN